MRAVQGRDAIGEIGRGLLFAHLLLSPLVFSKQTAEGFEFVKVGLLLLTALVLLGLGATRLARDGCAAVRREALAGLARDPVALGVLAVVAAAALTTLTSISPWTSLVGADQSYAGLATVVAYGVLFFATRALVRGAEAARRLLLAPVIAAGVAAGYALMQVVQVDPLAWARTATIGRAVRPFATMGHPNFLAAYLVMAAPLAALAADRAARAGQRIAMGVAALVAGLACAAVVLSVSRGAWLALLVSLLVLAAGWAASGTWRGAARVGVVVAASGVGLLVVATLAPGGDVLPSLVDRARHIADSPGRGHIWRAAVAIFRRHPLVGSGLDTFQTAFQSVRTPLYWLIEWNATPVKAHNEALHVLATEGLVGAVAAAALTGAVAVAAVRAFRRDGADRRLVIAVVAASIGFGVQALFSFAVAGCGTLLVTLTAMLATMASPRAAAPSSSASGLTGFAVVLAGSALAAVIVGLLSLPDGMAPDALVAGASAAIVATLIVGCAAAFVIERGAASPVEPDRRRRSTSPPPRSWSASARVTALSAWVLVVVAAWFGVAHPVRASIAAREGLQGAADPRSSYDWMSRAVALDPTRELYRVYLSVAAQNAARVTRDRAERDRLREHARAAIETSIRMSPMNAYNRANLARLLAELAHDGRIPPADVFSEFDRALRMDPYNALFLADAGSIALALGDIERAKAYATRGAELYPAFGPALAQLGYIALRDRRPADAEVLLRRAVDGDWHGADAAQASAASNLAAAALELGQAEQARAAATTALHLAPELVEARLNLGKAFELQGRRRDAIEEYRRALREAPSDGRARDALHALGAL